MSLLLLCVGNAIRARERRGERDLNERYRRARERERVRECDGEERIERCSTNFFAAVEVFENLYKRGARDRLAHCLTTAS